MAHHPGMELRLEAADGCSVPSGISIGVRVGEVLKQGKYDPARCFRFPQAEKRKHAKIDIYKHVGSCTIPIDPDAPISRCEANVKSEDPSISNMRFKVYVAPGGPAQTASDKPQDVRALNVRNQAKEYLSKHNVEYRLSDAVKALLREQPADPTGFICTFLKGTDGNTSIFPSLAKTPPSPAVVRAASAQSAKPAPPIVPFVDYYKKSCKPCCSKVFWGNLYSNFPARASGPPVDQELPSTISAAPSNIAPDVLLEEVKPEQKAVQPSEAPAAPTPIKTAAADAAPPAAAKLSSQSPTLTAPVHVEPVACIPAVATVLQKHCHRPSVGTWASIPMPLNKHVPQIPEAVVTPPVVPQTSHKSEASSVPLPPIDAVSVTPHEPKASSSPPPPVVPEVVTPVVTKTTAIAPSSVSVAAEGKKRNPEHIVIGLADAAMSAVNVNVIVAAGLAAAAAAAAESMCAAQNGAAKVGPDPGIAKGLAEAAIVAASTNTIVARGFVHSSVSCSKASARASNSANGSNA